MSCYVIDTNVLLIANEQHDDVSPECLIACINILKHIKKHDCVVIDDMHRILNEYQNKTEPRKGKRVGDVFLKWLLQNLNNKKHCQQVSITESTKDIFEEFPNDALQQRFDPPDRKFVAVANKHPEKPPILQAADCKWLDWKNELADIGIHIEFLCLEDIRKFYQKKFPNKLIPSCNEDFK